MQATGDLARAVITVKEKNHTASCYVQPVDVRMSEEKGILIDLFEESTTYGKNPRPGYWLHLDDPDTELSSKALTFRVLSFI